MLEEKDLQAITQLMKDMEGRLDAKLTDMEGRLDAKMDARLTDMEDRLDAKMDARLTDMEGRLDAKMDARLAEAKQEIMRGVSILMEQEFRPQFNLLAEGQQLIREKLGPLDDLEVLDTRVSALEAMVKKINRELAQLKKVQ